MNIKLNISYDGTNFSGWQIQPKQRTVQNELQKAIQSIFKTTDIKLKGSGRTDSGVHANAQIANFCINTKMKSNQIKVILFDSNGTDEAHNVGPQKVNSSPYSHILKGESIKPYVSELYSQPDS